MKILIVEDDKTYAEVLKEFLTFRLQTEIELVHDHKQVQSTAESFKPHLILLDLGLGAHPEASGLPVLQKLSEGADTKDIPVIIISGYNEANILKQVISRKVAEYAVKPINLTDLLARIKKVLGKKNLI
ncbi:MAG: response regulator transcription factor [Candidatus Aureabacteria bacterium]|nr:response regulator transcription factor [Candidatus Auribacterota bacterium]